MKVTLEALTAQQIEEIHELTLQYLEEHGVSILHEPSRAALQEHGAVVEDHIVKIPRTMAETYLAKTVSEFTVAARDPKKSVHIGVNTPYLAAPTSGSAFITEGDSKRYANETDWENMVKIAHTSDVCRFAYCNIVTPHTEDAAKSLKKQVLGALLMSDKAFISNTQDEMESRYSIEMAKLAVNQPDSYCCIGVLNSLSPLVWDEKMAGAIYTYAQMNQPIVLACCSMAGFTSHINLLDTILMNNIEIISGVILAQVLRLGLPCVYGNVSGSSDMKAMNLSTGSPDTLILSASAVQMAKFYHLPVRSGGGLTDAKVLDAQCGVESANMMFQTMAVGVNFGFHALGQLEGFNSMSPEKWILDEENYRRAYYVLNRDLGEHAEGILDVISEIGPGGNYLYEDSTMDNFRDAFFLPQVADRMLYDNWKERGKTIEEVCRELWKKRVEAYVQPEMDPTLKKELERLCEQAMA